VDLQFLTGAAGFTEFFSLQTRCPQGRCLPSTQCQSPHLPTLETIFRVFDIGRFGVLSFARTRAICVVRCALDVADGAIPPWEVMLREKRSKSKACRHRATVVLMQSSVLYGKSLLGSIFVIFVALLSQLLRYP
jgi:hypothetical protein